MVMMFLKKYINTVKQDPFIFLLGLSVLSIALMGTSVRHMSSIIFTLLVLLGFSIIKDWRKIFSSLCPMEKMFLVAFLLYTASGILSFYNVDDVNQYYKIFERFLRFSLIVPVYLFLIKKNVSVLNYLYMGAVISGPFLFLVGLQHSITYPGRPAQGYYHHIIFGQLAMLNVGIMLSMLLTKNFNRNLQIVILISMLFGLVTAVTSEARGVWLVFPIYVSVAVYYAVSDKRIKKKNVAAFLAVIVLLAMFTSVGDLIKQRTDAAISEITKFYIEDQYISSVGTRLAMWDIAIDVWGNYPLLGTGPGDFDDEIIGLQKQGAYVGMPVHNSVHNIYIQALVGTGLIGISALIFVTFIMPLRLFFKLGGADRKEYLTGFITVISFAIFGISESWLLRLSITSVFLVYIIVIASHMSIVRKKKSV